MNQFKIYKSSAGSGKTFTLVKEYLRLVLQHPSEYKNILALTFTNKATGEMKSRIIGSLIGLSKNQNIELKELLQPELPGVNIMANAQLALDNILHDYSNFSISTIDSFFNRIIRSLAREISLPLRLDVQLDMDEVITEITGQLMLDISTDEDLAGWLTDFTIQKLREDRGWNIEAEIYNIIYELFKEKSLDWKSHSRAEIKEFLVKLKKIKTGFENRMRDFGQEGLKIIAQNGLNVEDFSRKASGPAGYFLKITNKNIDYSFNSYQSAGLDSSDAWSTKTSALRNQVVELSESKLMPLLNLAHDYYENEYPQFVGATEVLKRIFLLGIVEDLKKKLSTYRDENNLLLISDTTKLLSNVISEDEAPFVYEKSGNRYRHFLIDEFQDTSDLQWKNLLPLVINSLSAGNFSMVVGDVKQSIYRWRSGNMNLLDSEIKEHLAAYKSITTEENLDTNFRSKKTIVDFNNEFFKIVPSVINEALQPDEKHLLHRAYSDELLQKIADKNGAGGKVEVLQLEDEENEEGKISWKEKARLKILDTIRDAGSRGYSYGDIAILVRNNIEDDDIASFLIDNDILQVISPDSLLLHRSAEVRFLISAFRFLDDNRNHIAAAELMFYQTGHETKNNTDLHRVFSEAAQSKKIKKTYTAQSTLFNEAEFKEDIFYTILPEEFTGRLQSLSRLPVYELAEQLLGIFNLSSRDAYILRFLDLILEYGSRHDSSLKSFLDWWDETAAAEKISVITSENADAIRIMTIHKAKGLQFPVVIIPYANWSITPKANEVFWTESNKEPFTDFGKVPLGFTKNLKNSVFRESYEDEAMLTVVDNVNMLYVAFTRAEDELYVFFQQSSSEEMNGVGKLIGRVIGKNEQWSDEFSGKKKLLLGESLPFSGKKETADHPFELKNFNKLKWQEKIRLSLKSDELLELFDTSVSRAINYGVLVHRVLSSVRNVQDIDKAVDRIFFEGLINLKEKEKLKSEILSLLNEKEIAHFFSDQWDVLAEREIILPDGNVLRPDRVLIKDDTAVVIDFKTGKEHPSHQKQVKQYADALLKMKYRSVDKFLIYIPEKRIVKVD